MAVTQDWQGEASCRDEDPELFFPLGEEGPFNQRQIAQAKAVCHGCTVAADCLDWALRGKIPEGIFGGMTGSERSALLRRMARERAAAQAVA